MPIEMPLSTKGRFIVDAHGRRVRLAGVNWYGFHEDLGVAPAWTALTAARWPGQSSGTASTACAFRSACG